MNGCNISGYKLRTLYSKLRLPLWIQRDVKKNVMEVASAKDTLQYILHIFSAEREIWPDQCSYAISCLSKTSSNWQNLCHLFDKATSPSFEAPLDLSINELSIMLYYICQQITQLIELITTFRATCRTSSKRKGVRQAEIARKFEMFMQISDELMQDIRDLLAEAQPKQFTSLFSDQMTDSIPREEVEEEQQTVVDDTSNLPDKSQRIKHLVDVGKDFQSYHYYMKDNNNREQGSQQNTVSSHKDL